METKYLLAIMLVFIASVGQLHAQKKVTCTSRQSKCFAHRIVCPRECPDVKSTNPKDKVCYLDCNSPICKAECKHQKPNCNGRGAACLDPRFIGGDGSVFYFHGRRNENFSLVSDTNFQINAHFIGLRPEGRSRDYTWIQALGILFDSQNFSVQATPATKWADEVDHLRFTYNEKEVVIPEGHLSSWKSSESELQVERTSSKNSVKIILPEVMEISINVVPITKEDDRVHNYQIPSDNCFAHLETQFRFFGLSSKVEGVLGRTYQPDFESSAKLGVAMPVVGGEDKYSTSSLLSPDCKACIFLHVGASNEKDALVMDYGFLDCTGGSASGHGIMCRK
ncbi:hypothetical protein ACFE04_023312 [Oxalis oulophora]